MNLSDFWQHSLAVGVLSRRLARHIGTHSNQLEEFFVCRLLHDIGKVLLQSMLASEYGTALDHAQAARIQLHLAEKEVLGVTHTKAGEVVVSEWGLGRTLGDVIEAHHHPDHYRGRAAAQVRCVAVANLLAILGGLGAAGDTTELYVAQLVMRAVRADPSYLDEHRDDVVEEIEDAQRFFGVALADAAGRAPAVCHVR